MSDSCFNGGMKSEELTQRSSWLWSADLPLTLAAGSSPLCPKGTYIALNMEQTFSRFAIVNITDLLRTGSRS